MLFSTPSIVKGVVAHELIYLVIINFLILAGGYFVLGLGHGQ